MTTTVASGLAAVLLAGLHLGGRRLLDVEAVPRRAWLSAASGISLAYVFVHLLPEVAHIAAELEETSGPLASLERNAWILALAGLIAFYALEQAAERSKADTADGITGRRVGWLHIASYATYNLLIGYLLLEQAELTDTSMWAFAAAMGVHFVVNDHSLKEDHGRLYHHRGRYLLAAAVLIGWVGSLLAELPSTAVGMPLAFLAGSIVLTVVKEELPEDRRSKVVPLVLGAAGYTAVLLTI